METGQSGQQDGHLQLDRNFKLILALSLAFLLFNRYVLWFIACSFVFSILIIWLSFEAGSRRVRHDEKLRDTIPRFKFIDSWHGDIEQTQTRGSDDEPLFPHSFLISESVDNIIEYILRDFVRSWYVNVSQRDDTFVKELQRELRDAVQRLSARLSDVDIPDLIVLKLVPTVLDHFNNYVIAEELVRSKKKTVADFDTAVAFNFNKGKLHPAIRSKSLSFENDRKIYLRDSIDSVLPYIVSEKEIASSPVRVLLKNILTSCVLFPSLSMLCEADFWNQMIVNSIGIVLKDRYQVEKFRSVLDLHSTTEDGIAVKTSATNAGYSQNSLMKKHLLTTKSSQQQFDKIIRKVSSSRSIPEMKQLRYYTSLQLSNVVRQTGGNTVIPEDIKAYNKRLQLLQKAIDDRLGDSDFNGKNFKPVSLPKNSKLGLSLTDILSNPASLTYFMEFMEQRSRAVLLQFWLTVNGIRSPLEDLDDYENADSDDDEELIAMSLSLDLSQSEDITQIFQQFFHEKILKIDPVIYNNVATFTDLEQKNNLSLYVTARKSLLVLQKDTYDRMEKTDFLAFKESDLFLRLLATEDLFTESKSLSPSSDDDDDDDDDGDPLVNYDEVPDNEQDHEKIGDNVIRAVEDALNEIMIDEKDTRPNLSSRPSSVILNDGATAGTSNTAASEQKSAHTSPSELQRELFGLGSSETSLFDEIESSMVGGGDLVMEKRNSRLFDDEESDSEAEASETMSNFENNDAGVSSPRLDLNEVQLAAPGDLNLAEEITKLTAEIGRYQKQVSIIDPLIRKSEITNNVAELKILRKSKASLEREIEQKELQKQQYIVQENDNSLFGKSRVRIQSYVPEKNSIFYIIEVQRLSAEDHDVVTAGWVVPRRFSQFYKLHEYLKLNYAEVQQLPFPKRKVVLKFQQTSLVEERKNQLERYLQQLLTIPQVCSNKLFRSFLSSEVFAIDLNNSLNSSTKMSRREKVESVANKFFYSTWSSRVPLSTSNLALGGRRYYASLSSDSLSSGAAAPLPMAQDRSSDSSQFDEQVNDMQKELNSFDEVGKVAFIKPICDLIISVFSLKKSNAWLRGRAIVVVLQQFLGSTIEKRVRENLNYFFKTENKILDLLVLFTDKLWPDGKFRESGKPRSAIEKSSTKSKSKMVLEKFLADSTSKIFGGSNSKFASSKIHSMLQNEIILNNLIFSLYDDIIAEVFPETVD